MKISEYYAEWKDYEFDITEMKLEDVIESLTWQLDLFDEKVTEDDLDE